jgi:Carboxypeptidase regulatory-like domain
MGNLRHHPSVSGPVGLIVLVASLVAALNLMIWPDNALACECAPPPPPCAEYSATPIIFLGTVTEAIQTENGWVRLARMRIDKAYKGISEETVLLYDSGMCDGPSLRLGEQYLMYTHDEGTSYLPSRGCTRSRNVKYADEDLAFLNSLAGAAPTGTISGKVTMSTGDLSGKGDPLSGATIEVLNEQEKATTTTDSSGRYSFFGLQPGAYLERATKPGFTSTESEDEDTAKVEARGCAVLDLVLRKNWPGTIRGRVIRPDGTPAQAGFSLDLIRVAGKGRSRRSEILIGATAETNGSGEYSFVEVAPGSYKIALNLYKVPTADDPYPAQYWPHAATEQGGSAIEINENLNSQRCDFQLPVALTSTPVEFVVLLPDGTPAREVHANIGTQMDGMFQWAGSVETDASGNFTFSAVQGFQYTVMDIMTDDAVMRSKVHFLASNRARPITIKLVPKDR